MGADQGCTPLLVGRGALSFEDSCLSIGLGEAIAEGLMRSGRLDGALFTQDDLLPSRASLVAMGLTVRHDDDPDAPRHGGIECETHGWAPGVLHTRSGAQTRSEVADRTVCWECAQAGVSADDAPGEVEARLVGPILRPTGAEPCR